MPETVVATPGVDRVVQFSVNGHEFGFRRPSRADTADVARRYALKTAPVTGHALEAATIESMDGANLEWEARLEIGLAPRRDRAGQVLNLGEKAPSHWFDGEAISFANVDPDEFEAVCAHLSSELGKKKASPPPSSGSSAASSNSD